MATGRLRRRRRSAPAAPSVWLPWGTSTATARATWPSRTTAATDGRAPGQRGRDFPDGGDLQLGRRLSYFGCRGDFNGDGKSDLTVANQGSNIVGVLLGNGNGTFRRRQRSAPAAPVPMRCRWGLQRRRQERPGRCKQASGNVGVLLGNGNGTFLPATTFS